MQDKTKTLRPVTLNPKYIQYKKDREVWIRDNLTKEQIQKVNTLSGQDLIDSQREIGLIDFVRKYWKFKK